MVAYKDLQNALDAAMPDQIMDLQGKLFRKKGYWRAVAVAFNLKVVPVYERREVAGAFADETPNFGYVVSYEATSPNGRVVTGDGTCFAIEKAAKFRCPHPERPGSTRTIHYPSESCPDYDPAFRWGETPAQATEHNVRSHAHTRAFNRAVSNLVGFGEVSAEETEVYDDDDASAARPEPKSQARPMRGRTVKGPKAAPAPAPTAPTATSDPSPSVAPSLVKGHVTAERIVKEGTNKSGAWALHGAKVEGDSREFFTFDTKLAHSLRSFIGTTTQVELTVMSKPGTRNPGELFWQITQCEPFRDVGDE
jgi:hypothetical protein